MHKTTAIRKWYDSNALKYKTYLLRHLVWSVISAKIIQYI